MGQKFTRQELYDLVWSRPMQTAAANVGISDVGLAKYCRSANIPVPSRGYWAKRQAGKPALKQALTPRFPGASDIIEIGGSRNRYRWDSNWWEEILEEPIPPVPTFDEDIDAVAKRVQKMVGKLSCPVDFNNAYNLIATVLAQDEKRAADYARYKSEYNAPKYKAGIGRRWLLILNAIFLCMQAYRCTPKMKTSRYLSDRVEERVISVHVRSQYVYFILEPISAAKSKERDQTTSQRLRFAIVRSPSNLQPEMSLDDAPHRPLENRISEIVVAIFLAAERDYRASAACHREWLIRRKEEARIKIQKIAEEKQRQEQERLAEEAKQRVDRLLAEAADFHRAQTIRDYVASVRQRLFPVKPEHFAKWETWALEQAEHIDPVSNGMLLNSLDAL